MGTLEYDLNKKSYQVIIVTFLHCDKGIIVTLDNVLILEDAEIFKNKNVMLSANYFQMNPKNKKNMKKHEQFLI